MADAKHPGYKVTGALVIAADVTGKLRHHYHGAWVPWLNDVQRPHFLRHKLVEELQAPEAPEAAPAAPAAVAKPAKTAADELWLAYGVAQGHSRDELAALGKAELREFLS